MSLRVWLPLNGDLHNQGLSNVTVTNNGATINTSGKIGNCYEFNNSKNISLTDYVAEFLTYTNWSISLWFKCTAQNTAHTGSALISSGNWNQATQLLQFSLGYFSTDHYTKLLITNSSNWSNGYTYNFYLNTWYHVVLVSGNNKMSAYVNGELIGDSFSAYTPVSSAQADIGIGKATYYSGMSFFGLMNDVRIYDHALSVLEVKEIARGLVLHYPLNHNGWGLDNILINNSLVYDISGYCNNGTEVGTFTYSIDTPKYRFSTTFSGSASCIKVNENSVMAQYAQAMTINLWAKASSWAANTHFFSCTESGGFNTEAGNSGYLRFPLHVCTNAAQTSYSYKYDSQEIQLSALPTNEWVMLTWVYDTTGTRTYINGQLHHTYTNTSYGIHFNTNARLFLGCEASGANPTTPYFNGKMSDFRMYYTALSAQDILSLYHNSALIDEQGIIHGAIY